MDWLQKPREKMSAAQSLERERRPTLTRSNTAVPYESLTDEVPVKRHSYQIINSTSLPPAPVCAC
jgi:hypothetical protein